MEKIRTVEEDKRLRELCHELTDLFESDDEWHVLVAVLRAYHQLKLESRYFTPGKNRYRQWDSEIPELPKLKLIKNVKKSHGKLSAQSRLETLRRNENGTQSTHPDAGT